MSKDKVEGLFGGRDSRTRVPDEESFGFGYVDR